MAPAETEPSRLTDLLIAHADGDTAALDQAFSLVYDELRRLARYQRRGFYENSLNTTGLVHEAYVKLAAGDARAGARRKEFFAIAAKAMRHVLIDACRARTATKRGSGKRANDLEPDQLGAPTNSDTLLAINEALGRLERAHPRLAAVFECRYFGGYSESETADTLDLSLRTTQRSWSEARRRLGAWLAAT